MQTYTLIGSVSQVYGNYRADANGIISNVAFGDVAGLVGQGCRIIELVTQRIPFGVWDGNGLTPVAPASNSPNYLSSPPVSLVSPADAPTSTGLATAEYILPDTYVTGTPLSFVFKGCFVWSVTGTLSSSTLSCQLYSVADDGTVGANLVTTSPATLSTTPTDFSFTANGLTLSAGQGVLIAAQPSNTISAGSGSTQVFSVRLEYWSAASAHMVESLVSRGTLLWGPPL